MLSPQNADVTKDSAVLTPLDGSTAIPAPAPDVQAESSSSALSQSQTSTSADQNVLVSSDAYASQATGTAQATGATQDIGAADTLVQRIQATTVMLLPRRQIRAFLLSWNLFSTRRCWS